MHSHPERITGIEREISQTATRADLRVLRWHSIPQLLTSDIENNPTFKVGLPCTVSEMKIEDPCAFFQRFTHNPSLGSRISQNRQEKVELR